MSFRENLLKKIKIDKLANQAMSSLGPPDSGRRLDKQVMRNLLEMAPYKGKQVRDLELYIKENEGRDKKQILVLDNDLAIYNTDIEDVALRKSPTVKEMISIRNIKKILSDTDVVKSRKEESVRTVQKECIDILDLDYSEEDIEAIKTDGEQSLETEDIDGVKETLMLFEELLNLSRPPKIFKIAHVEMLGRLAEGEKGEVFYGPGVLYNIADNALKLVRKKIGSYDKQGIEFVHQVAVGNEKPDMEGYEVFEFLKDAVMGKNELAKEPGK